MSTNQTLQLTPAQINYADTAQWKRAIRTAFNELRVAIPCIVQSFDPTMQTVSVQIAIRECVKENSGPVYHPIAVINLVPVAFPSAGGFSVTLPVQAGDEGLLVFCDMCIDLWWMRGDVQNQFERRRHDLTDCEFIPGGRSKPRALPNYSPDSLQVCSDDGTTYVEIASGNIVNIVAPGGINISGDVNVTGNITTSGDGLIDGVNIKTHTHGGVTTGSDPTGPPL